MAKVKILIVEDEPTISALIQYELKSLGYKNIGSVLSGEEAIKEVNENPPDIVLMDIILKGKLNGIQTAEEIRNTYNIPVVFLTGYEDDDLFQKAKITDPFGYIIKPFNAKDLKATLEIALYKDRHEKELQATKEYVENILNSSLDMIIAVDNNRKITEFNKAAEENFGYSREEVIGKHINLLYGDVKKGLAIHKKVLKNGRCVEEILNRHKNGSTFPSLLVGSILHDSKGNKVGVMGISHDITELNRTKEALRESQEYAKNIISSSFDMIIAVNKNRRIAEFNQAAEETFGYKRKEVLGKHVNLLYSNKKEGLKVHQITMENRRHVQEILNRRKNGEEFLSLLSSSILRDQHGEIVGVMGISRDITELKIAEEKLRKSEKKYRVLAEQLEQTNNLKELLLDVISHDLKNPAGVIKGMADLSIQDNPDNETTQLIADCCDDLLKVIDNATTLSKAASEEAIEKHELDLSEMLSGVVKEFSFSFSNLKMKCIIDVPETLVIVANPLIVEIFRNYMSNAVKYASQGKQLVLKAEKMGKWVVVAVTDFGTTIPENDRERIFDRITQLEKGAKGRGLGLAITKRLAEAHGGRVWVEPNKPRGNIFYTKLPVGY